MTGGRACGGARPPRCASRTRRNRRPWRPYLWGGGGARVGSGWGKRVEWTREVLGFLIYRDQGQGSLMGQAVATFPFEKAHARCWVCGRWSVFGLVGEHRQGYWLTCNFRCNWNVQLIVWITRGHVPAISGNTNGMQLKFINLAISDATELIHTAINPCF